MNGGKESGVGIRCGNDDLSVDQLLVKLGVLALLVGRGYEGVALVLEPLADAELVLRGTEQTGHLRNGSLVDE